MLSRSVFVVLSMIFFSSCLRLGINPDFKTPKKAAKLPQFTIKDSLKGSLTPGRACYDVNYYDINVKIDPDKKIISGFVSTYFTVTKKTVFIQIDLAPQFQISRVEENGKPLYYSRNHTAILIKPETDYEPNEKHVIKVIYSGEPKIAKDPPWKGGFVWKKDKSGKHWCAVACEGEGAWSWLPIKGYLGDEPDSIETHFTVPSNLQCVSNGILTGTDAIDGNWTCFSRKVHYPINPYNITYYIGDFKKIEMPYVTADKIEMSLEFFVLEANYEKAKEHFKQTTTILKVYEECFGPYPWPKDGYRLIESPYAGMEHQSAIAYGNGYKNTYKEDFDDIILHETAHEWWGNAVSVSDFSDIWIHEGLASYAEALYIEKTKGYKPYVDYVWGQGMFTFNKSPLILPKGVFYWNYKDGDVYMKGSAAIHTLRNIFDDDYFFLKALREFNMENRYKNVSTVDFFTFMKTKTKENLDPFIRQYFYKRESPLLCWNFTTDSDGKDIFVCFFERVGSDFAMPVTIEQNGRRYKVMAGGREKAYIKLPNSENISVNSNMSYFELTRRSDL